VTNHKGVDYFLTYDVETAGLTNSELQVLEKLLDAARLAANIYKLQRSGKKDASFYPADATRVEIERAAEADEEILSPYTVVERDEEGKLVAIPYHLKYKKTLEVIAEKLVEAAQISNNNEFAQVLRIQAEALLTGSYDKAQIAWMSIKPYKLSIVIGPMERIEDEWFFVKRSYEAWVGIMNQGLTERAIEFKDTVFSLHRELLFPSEKVDFMDKSQIRVDDTYCFAGMIANFKYTGTTLPNEIELMGQFGSEATIFLPVVKESFNRRHLPIFETIFSEYFRKSFKRSDLERGYLYTVMLHEIARVLVRYKFATSRLRELYPIYQELTVEALAVKLCGNLFLKSMISQSEMEAVLVMFLTRIFDYYFEIKDSAGMRPYVLGNAILLNSLLSSGALISGPKGFSWPDFTKMFIATSNLADLMERILAEGTYTDAKDYLDKNSTLKVFKSFSPELKEIVKISPN
jgi:hypothetical protein